MHSIEEALRLPAQNYIKFSNISSAVKINPFLKNNTSLDSAESQLCFYVRRMAVFSLYLMT